MGKGAKEVGVLGNFTITQKIEYAGLLCLILAGLSSALIPEAANTAMRFKWLIILESISPLLVVYRYRVGDYFAMHRAAGIWVCNSFILMFAYFYEKAYLRRDIRRSEDLKNFVSENPESGLLAFPCIIGSFGIIPIIFAFLIGMCVCGRTFVVKWIRSPGLLLLVILGLFMSSFFLIPTVSYKLDMQISFSAQLDFSGIIRLLNVLRPVQIIMLSLFISAKLAFPMSLELFNLRLPYHIVTAVILFVNAVVCLCSALQIDKAEFNILGVGSVFWNLATVCLNFYQTSENK